MIDVIALNYNDAEETIRYVNSIKEYKSISNIVVVDNYSTDNSYELISQIKNDNIHILQSGKNGGYGYSNNCGIKYSINKMNSKYIAITNPDVKYSDSCLENCKKFLISNKDKGIRVCAPRMKDLNNHYVKSAWLIPGWFRYVSFSLFLLGKIFKLKYIENENNDYSLCQCVAGSMLVVDAEAIEKVNMYDEDIFLYCEETVLGIKMELAGYKTAILNREEFIHAHSVSINKSISSKVTQQKIMWKSRLIVLKKYYHLNNAQLYFSYCLSRLGILAVRIKAFRDKINEK